MAPAHAPGAVLTVILLIGACRVLLSLVYLDERLVAGNVQTPYDPPISGSEVLHRNVKEQEPDFVNDAGKDGEHNLNDLMDKGRGDSHWKDADLNVKKDEVKKDEVKKDEVKTEKLSLSARKVLEFETKLKKLKGKWLHEKLQFWTPSVAKMCQNGGEGLYLLTVVNSEPLKANQREAIRETWGSQRSVDGENVQTLFMVGHPTSKAIEDSLEKKVIEECDNKGDVIGTSVIEPKKLSTPSTLRILATFKYVLTHCPLVKYVSIGPENLFVDQENMIKYLKALNNPTSLYLGRVRKDGKPQRDAKYKDYVDLKTYKPEAYPKYCVGGAGFVVSTQFIQDAYLKSMSMAVETMGFNIGDVYLGMIALNLKVWPKYKDSFLKLGGDADYCDLKGTITLGGFGTEDLMRSVWRNHSLEVVCSNPIPNVTDIEHWTGKMDNSAYFSKVLKLIHHPKKTCWKNPKTKQAPYLLALVSSMPEHFELRAAIRKTWAAPDYMTKTNSKTLFILGKSRGMTTGMQDAIDEEARQNSDIIQADFLESFHNLTLKVILGLRWVSTNCKQASFIYKGDDDMLVNFERITGHLQSLPRNQSQNLFLGHMMGLSPVVREKSKYQVLRSQYPFKYFLPYFSGGGYIMSSAAVKGMYDMTRTTKLIPIDDAYAGILAFRSKTKINLNAASSKYFITTGSRKDACFLRKAFNLHGFKRTDFMKETWAEFMDQSTTCEEPNKLVPKHH
ncbi:uncharacterized protein [Asterias amurensis]|uniref:uncharacterized protein n=1 Tax=Asterias amurensis TaxID=7602 RepID=UPI003AB3D252